MNVKKETTKNSIRAKSKNMYINSHNNVSYITGQVQEPTDMLTREEQFLIVSINSPPRPDLSGLWSQYSQAIVQAKKLKSTAAKTKMGVVMSMGMKTIHKIPKTV